MTTLHGTTGRWPSPTGRLAGTDRILDWTLGVFLGALGIVAALAPRGMAAWMLGLLALTGAVLLRRPMNWRRWAADPARRLPALAGAGFVALVATSVAWSPSPRAAQTALEIAGLALAGWAFAGWIALLDSHEAARIGSLFLIGLGIGALVFTAEYSLGFPMNRLFNGLVHGVPPNFAPLSNNVPKRAMALLTAFLWAAAFLTLRRYGRRAAGLLLAGSVLALLAQPSRSAAVGALIGLVVFLCALRRPTAVRRALAGLLVLVSLAVIPAALALRDAGADRSALLFRSAQHRVEIWGRAAGRSLDAPWAGHGIDASRALRPMGETSRFETLNNTLLPLHPHNAFLQIWLELGGAGMALVLALGLSALAATRRLPADGQPFALGYLGAALSMASTAYGLWQAWWLAGLLTAGLLLWLAARVPRHSPGVMGSASRPDADC